MPTEWTGAALCAAVGPTAESRGWGEREEMVEKEDKVRSATTRSQADLQNPRIRRPRSSQRRLNSGHLFARIHDRTYTGMGMEKMHYRILAMCRNYTT